MALAIVPPGLTDGLPISRVVRGLAQPERSWTPPEKGKNLKTTPEIEFCQTRLTVPNPHGDIRDMSVFQISHQICAGPEPTFQDGAALAQIAIKQLGQRRCRRDTLNRMHAVQKSDLPGRPQPVR